MQKATKHVWNSPAPGIAKRQSSTEWISQKLKGDYSLLPKLSPTSDENGRESQMSLETEGSVGGSTPVRVLFDDTDSGPKQQQARAFSEDDSEEEDVGQREVLTERLQRTASVRSSDSLSTDSSRAALRLACSSPPTLPRVRSGNLISFQEEQPEDILSDTRCVSAQYGRLSDNNGFSSSSKENMAPQNFSSKSRQKRTSLEAIRSQIRQIELEIAQNRQQHRLNGSPGRSSRVMQPSLSTQSIPTDLAISGLRRPANGMQRAYSVDMAVHSAISEIQSAVRTNSMIRLVPSTPVLERPVILEEDESDVWVKRDSFAQTDVGDTFGSSTPAKSRAFSPLLHTSTPDMDEEMENENVFLLRETSLGGPRQPCENRIGNLSRQLPTRRHSCQSSHELIEGVLFRCFYLGSTHLFSDTRPTKASRLTQAQEAVGRIKAPDGESQPMTDVDLFISIEKIMVLNADIQDTLMEHPLRTISYIADIGDLVVLMVKRGLEDLSCDSVLRSSQPKMLCHVFQSDEAPLIAQTIGNAFQVAYVEYLKANGIQDEKYLRHLDYMEVLNSQEMSTTELELFASKEQQINVIIPKQKGEILGVVIVESGWGSMLPTVIIANMCPGGPAARCGKLTIGDQLISIDGISLVGLPLAQCQSVIKNVKNHTVVKLTIVHCPPAIEVRIKRPDTRYQLGFSVQNGIICSLLRGGIAERGGIRVGHRIIEINGQSVVATSHETIVNMLAHSVGEIQLKTMPSSIFRLLTGQDVPVYI